MQSSITMFFKSKDKPRESSQRNIQRVEESLNHSATPQKRPAEDEVNSTTPKRQAIDPKLTRTPTRSEFHKLEDVSTPDIKTNHAVGEGDKSLALTPLRDTTALIRSKINNGATALHENIGKSWFKALQPEFDRPYFRKLSEFVKHERESKEVFPPDYKVYTWTRFHDIRETKVVILGQDPYHGYNQAHGLSFSVQKGIRIPPSLINIFKELENDIEGFISPSSGDLTGWARQGVLLLNTCLTVNQGQANSHQGRGWETFTDAVIKWLSKNMNHKLVFLLWGSPAQKKAILIDARHKILKAVHPSPLSAHRGFFGCKHFSQTNQFLKQQKLPEIDWKAL